MLTRVIDLAYVAAGATLAVAWLFQCIAQLVQKASRRPLDERATLGLVVQVASKVAWVAWLASVVARTIAGRTPTQGEVTIGIVALSYGLLWSFERLRKSPDK